MANLNMDRNLHIVRLTVRSLIVNANSSMKAIADYMEVDVYTWFGMANLNMDRN